MQILGVDNNHPSQQTNAIVIRNNLFADIDSQNWGGNGYFISLTDGARDITVDHNTVISDHGSGVVTMDGPPVIGFRFTNNLMKQNAYGFIGTNHGVGMDAISAFFPARSSRQRPRRRHRRRAIRPTTAFRRRRSSSRSSCRTPGPTIT